MAQWIGPAIIASAISALVTAMGWLVALRQARGLDEARRKEKTIDIVKALSAEIRAGVGSSDEQLETEEANLAVKDDNPFGTPDDTDFVFESIKTDLTLLPSELIEEVILYYRLAKRSNLMTRDLRDAHFIAQPSPAKHKFVSQLLQVQRDQSAAGRAALNKIEAYAAANKVSLSGARDLPEPRSKA